MPLRFAFFIQDGQGHKYAWSVKGDSGSRFCCLCKNVFAVSNAAPTKEEEEEEEELELSAVSKFVKHSQLQLASSEEIIASWQRTQARAATCTQQELAMWEQACGIKCTAEALLLCKELEALLFPAEQFCHDWMHGLVSNGIMNICCFLLLESLECVQMLHGYAQKWTRPASLKGTNAAQLLKPQRMAKHKRSGKLSCSASELLSLLPVLAHFCRAVCVPAGAHLAKVNAFLALSTVLEMLQSLWHGGGVPLASTRGSGICT